MVSAMDKGLWKKKREKKDKANVAKHVCDKWLAQNTEYTRR